MAPWDVLSEEQRELRDLVRTLARERVEPRAAEIDRTHEFPWDIVELFREHELFRLLFDEDVGRHRHGHPARARRDRGDLEGVRDSGLILAVQELGSLGLKLAGTHAQRARYLPRLASGEWLAAYALTEAGSGSDAAAMRTTARRDGDGFVLDGTKRFITNAGVAGLYTVFAKTDADAGHRGISAFLVEARHAGLLGLARRAQARHPRIDDRRAAVRRGALPAEALLGEEGAGFRLAMRILDRSRPGIAAQAPRHRPGSDRLRARVREDARDDGQADRRAPADRGQARRHGDALRARARRALPLRADGRRGRRRSPS